MSGVLTPAMVKSDYLVRTRISTSDLLLCPRIHWKIGSSDGVPRQLQYLQYYHGTIDRLLRLTFLAMPLLRARIRLLGGAALADDTRGGNSTNSITMAQSSTL